MTLISSTIWFKTVFSGYKNSACRYAITFVALSLMVLFFQHIIGMDVCGIGLWRTSIPTGYQRTILNVNLHYIVRLEC